MRCNKAMIELLSKTEQNLDVNYLIKRYHLKKAIYPNIYTRQNYLGKPYICVNDFCGLNRANSVTKQSEETLTNLEWYGNEVYISLGSKGTPELLAQIAVIAIKSWKHIIWTQFSSQKIDIVASVDDGLMGEVDPSAVIRLYLVRNGYRILAQVDDYLDPVCLETIS